MHVIRRHCKRTYTLRLLRIYMQVNDLYKEATPVGIMFALYMYLAPKGCSRLFIAGGVVWCYICKVKCGLV